jgi:two-component sensor histidine kinase
VRAFGERERVVAELRPFLQADPASAWDEGGGRAAFDSLCKQVLNAQVAYLCPRLSFASALAYPANASAPCQAAAALELQAHPRAPALPIAREQFGGAQWAIPLTDERGALGVLLLGERADGSLYTQEEMEIARAAGERIVQAQANAELTRRLVELQRGRLATTQVVDRRARRELHDDILPQLHLAMLSLSAGETRDALTQLEQVHGALSNLLRAMPTGASPQIERYGVLGALRRAVDDEFANAFDGVTWETDPRAEYAAQQLSALNAEAVYAAAREAIRNAAKHGRGGNSRAPLQLTVRALFQDGLVIEIWDDGVGVTDSANGSGQGLQLHSTMMAVIGGTLTLERVEGKTRAIIRVPK